MKRHTLGFSLVELLIVVAIIGVLAGLVLPAIRNVKYAANRLECTNNLKQQGVALHGYHDVYDAIPPAVINPGKTDDGFATPSYYPEHPAYVIYNLKGFTFLLPFLEEDQLYYAGYQQLISMGYRFASNRSFSPPFTKNQLPYNGVTGPSGIAGVFVKAYTCPADENEPPLDRVAGGTYMDMAQRANYLFSTSTGATKHYRQVASKGLFGMNGAGMLAFIPDGASNTVAIGECKQMAAVLATPSPITTGSHWGSCFIYGTEFGKFTGKPINDRYGLSEAGFASSDIRSFYQSAGSYGSWHPGGANFLFADGSVHFLPNSTPVDVLESLILIDDGNPHPLQ